MKRHQPAYAVLRKGLPPKRLLLKHRLSKMSSVKVSSGAASNRFGGNGRRLTHDWYTKTHAPFKYRRTPYPSFLVTFFIPSLHNPARHRRRHPRTRNHTHLQRSVKPALVSPSLSFRSLCCAPPFSSTSDHRAFSHVVHCGSIPILNRSPPPAHAVTVKKGRHNLVRARRASERKKEASENESSQE